MKSTSGKVQKVSDMKCPQVSKVQVKLKLIKLYIFYMYLYSEYFWSTDRLPVPDIQCFFLIQPPIKLFNLKMRCFGSDAAFDLQSN